MSTYKITNITNHVNKRDNKYNSVLDIEYIDNMTKKTTQIRPNDSVYLTVQSLPLSAHKLRMKGLVTISEVSSNEFNALANNTQSKPIIEIPKEIHEDMLKETRKRMKKDEDHVE